MQVLSMLVIDACRFIQQPTWQDSAVPFRDDFGCRSRSAAGSRRRAEYRRDRSATSAAGNPATGQHPVYVTGPAIIFILLIFLYYSTVVFQCYPCSFIIYALRLRNALRYDGVGLSLYSCDTYHHVHFNFCTFRISLKTKNHKHTIDNVNHRFSKSTESAYRVHCMYTMFVYKNK